MKQVLVIRKDLNMRRGKEIAQGAHASQLALEGARDGNADLKIQVGKCEISPTKKWIDLDLWMGYWAMRKITVQVRDGGELLEIYLKAKTAGLPCALIRDEGLTEFKGILTDTAVGIGPAPAEEIDPITSHLPLR